MHHLPADCSILISRGSFFRSVPVQSDRRNGPLEFSIIIFSLSGGAGVVARNLVWYANQKGVIVNIVCGNADSQLASSLTGQLEVLGGRRVVQFALRMVIHHRQLAPRVIVFDPLLAGLLTPWLRKCSPRRRVAVRILTDPAQIIRRTRNRLMKWVKRKALWYGRRSADLLIGNSHGSLKSFFEECPAASELPAEVIYNPVVGLYESAIVCRSDFVSCLSASEPVRIFTAAGRLVDQKGFDLLILAIAQLVTEGFTDFRTVIFGDGPDRKKLGRLVRDHNIERYVHFFGSVPDLRPYLGTSDLFVLTSRYEGFGNVVVEALDAGLPVVAFDCPSGPREILSGGRNGRLVRPADSCALAEALGEFLTVGAEYSPEQQRQRATDFHINLVGARYLKLLQEM